MSSYIMAIDQGTTSTRTCLINDKGALIAQSSEAFPQIYPEPGWVEHDAEAIWASTLKTIRTVIEQNHHRDGVIAGLGLTNQRETVVAWNAHTGKSLGHAIVWQCRRTQKVCEQLRKARKQPLIQKKTGLVIDPYFSATKMQWMLRNWPAVKAAAKSGDLRFGTIDSFLLWRLTGGQVHATDVSNASRTMLMNIHTGDWDPELLKLFGIPRETLPTISPSSGVFGRTRGVPSLPDGIPVAGIAGDQQAALFGQTAFAVGDAKCTFGTGSFLLMNTGAKAVRSKSRLLTTVAWQLADGKMVYALEGGAFICGAAVQWLRDGLGLFSKSSEVEALAKSVEDTEGVEFVPALTGLGAPHWRPEARGVITGLTRGATKAHIARATLEAMALQNAEILMAMENDLGRKLRGIRVDGGASANNLLMQLQADYTGSAVTRPVQVETTAMGAAYLAGLGVGVWRNLDEIRHVWKKDREFHSKMTSAARKARLARWSAAVEKSFGEEP